MEARNRTLSDWFTRIRTRQVTLPRFQRFEAWSHYQVTSLLNTVLQELPAGAVLVLEIGDKEPFVSRPMEGAPEEGDRVVEQLLDGQQRLTALWRSLADNYEDRTYFVQLCADEETDAPFSVVAQSRWDKKGSRYPLWADDPVQLWKKKLIPLHLVRPDHDSPSELKEWAKLATNDDMDSIFEVVEKGAVVRGLFTNFNVPFLSLPTTTSKETALNVFIQMNTSATPLSAYDIVVAQVEAGTGQSLHDLIDDLKEEAPQVEAYLESSSWMMSVAAILQDKTPTKTTFLSADFSQNLIADWDRIKNGIRRACLFLQEERVFDNKRLPTEVVLYPLAALWAIAPDGLDAEGTARTILRKYLWRSFFTERYERTSATRSLVDFRQIRDVMLNGSTDVPLIFNEAEFSLPTEEELVLAGWPVRKDRIARAILAIAMRSGGQDFADGQTATRDNLARREYHHLFPDAWLGRNGFDDKQIYRSLNCGLVTWRTNRNISDKAPSKYLAERMDKSSLGESEVVERLKSHVIPFDEIVSNDYEAFLDKRAKLMREALVKLCDGISL